jgi:hypothetical protein
MKAKRRYICPEAFIFIAALMFILFFVSDVNSVELTPIKKEITIKSYLEISDVPLSYETKFTDTYKEKVDEYVFDAELNRYVNIKEKNIYLFNVELISQKIISSNSSDILYNLTFNLSRTKFGDYVSSNSKSLLSSFSKSDYFNVYEKESISEATTNDLKADMTYPEVKAIRGYIVSVDGLNDFNLFNNPSQTLNIVAGYHLKKDDFFEHGVSLKFGSASTIWSQETVLSEATNDPRDVVWSNDGKFFAYSSYDGYVYIHNTNDWSLNTSLRQNAAGGTAFAVAFNNDSTWFAYGDNAGEIYIYNTNDWSLNKTLSSSYAVYSIDFSDDGSMLAKATRYGVGYVYNTATWTGADRCTLGGSIYAVDFSSDGSMLAFGDSNGYIQILDTSTWSTVTSNKDESGGDADPFQIEFSRDGRFFVTPSDKSAGGEAIRVYNTTTWTGIDYLSDATELCYGSGFSKDSKWVACASQDDNLYIYSTIDWSLNKTINNRSENMRMFAFNWDNTYLAYSNNENDGVYIVDMPSEESEPEPETDSIVPIATATSPSSTTETSSTVTFTSKCSDNVKVENISLYTNKTGLWAVTETNNSPVNNTNWVVDISSWTDGSYKWGIICFDNSTNIATSNNLTFTVNINDLPVVSGVNIVGDNENDTFTDWLSSWTTTDADGNVTYNNTWYNCTDRDLELILDFNVENITDLSINQFTATTNGLTWDDDGGFDDSPVYSFDGTDDHIQFSDNTDLRKQVGSWSMWVYPEDNGADMQIFDVHDNRRALYYKDSTQKFSFVAYDGSFSWNEGTAGQPFNQWYHIVHTFDENGRFILYVNGTAQINISGFTTSFSSGRTITIGEKHFGGGDFKGRIDDVRVYDHVLTYDQVQEIYTRTYVLDSSMTDQSDVCQFNVVSSDREGYSNKGTDTFTINSCTAVSENLNITSDTTLCYNTYSLVDADSNGVIYIDADDVTLDCNGAIIKGDNTASSIGIYTDEARATIKNCNIQNFDYGFTHDNHWSSNSHTVLDSNFSDNEVGIRMLREGLYVNNSRFINSTPGDGVRFDGYAADSGIVENSYFEGGWDGVHIGVEMQNITVRKNTFKNLPYKHGIYMDTVNDIFIYNNTFLDSIKPIQGRDTLGNISIHNNYMYNMSNETHDYTTSTSDAVKLLVSGDNISIYDNIINYAYNAIYTSLDFENVMISNNTIQNIQNDAVHLELKDSANIFDNIFSTVVNVFSLKTTTTLSEGSRSWSQIFNNSVTGSTGYDIYAWTRAYKFNFSGNHWNDGTVNTRYDDEVELRMIETTTSWLFGNFSNSGNFNFTYSGLKDYLLNNNSISLYNLASPNHDIYNNTGSENIAYEQTEYNLTIPSNDDIFIGNYPYLDTVDPVATRYNPSNGETVGTTFNFSSKCTDNIGIDKIEIITNARNDAGYGVVLTNNSVVNNTIWTAEYTYETPGTFYWYAKCYDTSSNFVNTGNDPFIIEESDTCSCPASGKWDIDCADNCVISSDCNMDGSKLNISGTGKVTINASITGYGAFDVEGTDGSNKCYVFIESEGDI